MRLVFDLPDPRKFPPLTGFSAEEISVVRRYNTCCEELAESSVLSHATRVNVSWNRADDGSHQEKITAEFPAREAIRGTTVLFRQLFSNEERASYNTVRKLIGRRVHDCKDAESDRRAEMQKCWNGAHGQLRAYLLTFLADRKVCDASGWKAELPDADVKPEALIKLFQYGDLIHWGDGAEELSRLSSDEFKRSWNTMHYLTALTQLSHFYLGYSLLTKSAIGS